MIVTPNIVASYAQGAADIWEALSGFGTLASRKGAIKRWERAHGNGNSRNGNRATLQEEKITPISTRGKHPAKRAGTGAQDEDHRGRNRQ